MYAVRLCKPAPALTPFVEFYVGRSIRSADAGIVHPVPARAVPVIEFLFGDRFPVRYLDSCIMEIPPRAVVVGLQTHRRVQMDIQGPGGVIRDPFWRAIKALGHQVVARDAHDPSRRGFPNFAQSISGRGNLRGCTGEGSTG